MAIIGIVYDNQVPTAKALRGGFHSALSDGIIEGCNITYSGANVIIGGGLMHVAGGIFVISGTETIATSGNSGYARIKAVMDLTEEATTSDFSQVSFEVDYASGPNDFTALTQDAVNTGGGTTYEAEIAVVSLGSGGVTGIIRTATAASKILYGDTLPDDAPEGTIFLLRVQ